MMSSESSSDRRIVAKPPIHRGAPKRPQRPSHGRGHWFDPSSAHGNPSPFSGGGFLSFSGVRLGVDPKVVVVMALDRGRLANIDRRLFSELSHGAGPQTAKVLLSDAA